MAWHHLLDILQLVGVVAASVISVVLARRLGRRDQLEEKISEHGGRIGNIEVHLQDKTGYRPLAR